MTPSIQPKHYEPGSPQKVAFIGLGVMGYPMAGHLAQAGHQVTVYNRNQAKAEQWSAEFKQGRDEGREPVYRPHHCLRRSGPGTGSTGGQAGAQKGMLSIMCGGQAEDMERARPLMMSYAQACTLMGPLGSGQLCKMVNQIAVVGLLQGLAEAMAFGERAGLDMEQALSVLSKGAARSWQMETKGPTMLARDFQPGFTVNWMLKDLDLVQREAQRNGAQLPATRLIQEQFTKIAQQGHRDWDISTLFNLLARPNDAA